MAFCRLLFYAAASTLATAWPRDVVVSIYWGPNWGYPIPKDQRRLAHALIEEAGISIVHGHSSHHAKAIEIYRERLILYGLVPRSIFFTRSTGDRDSTRSDRGA